MASLTTDPSATLRRTTSKGSRNATSLPASADGAEPFDNLAFGRIIDRFGREAVLASLSPSRASKAGLLTSDTSGPTSDTSLRSAALQQCLENRLQVHLRGSDLCEVTWKPWATPWGQCLSKPRARVRTISETDTGLWQTMVQDDALERQGGKVNSRGEPKLSAQAIQASAWPTPTTRDHKDGGFCPNVPVNGLLGRMVWPTPRANEGTGAKTPPGRQGGMSLKAAVAATYPTPSASGFEAKDPDRLLQRRAECKERTGNGNGFGLTLGQFATLNGSQEQTEKPGALNPEFVCWLMGFPLVWVSCGVSGMQSIRDQRQRSSKR